MHMNSKKIIFYITLILGVLSPQTTISADAGPKSGMEFTFLQNGIQPKIEITHGILYVCERSDCQDAHIVPDTQYTGERELSCTEYHCYASLYGSYYRLEVTFSDGVTRKSNVFTQKFYVSEYSANIQEDSLVVQEENGSNLPIFFFTMIFLFCPASLLLFSIIIIGTIIYSLVQKDKKSILKTRLGNETKWAMFIFLFCAGMMLHPRAFILTITIECLLTYLFQKHQKSPYKDIVIAVFLVNLITHPIFTFTVMYFKIQDFKILIGFETIIWLLEACLIYLFTKKLYPRKCILVLSLVLNTISFSLGLLLPI